MTDQPNDQNEQTEEEAAADEALRVADWPRWALVVQRGRGGLTQRALDGIAHHHPDTHRHSS